MSDPATVRDPADLTPAWLTAALRTGGLDATVTGVRHEPVGTGQMAACYRLHLDGEGCPTTLVAKGTLADSEYYAGVSGLFSSREVLQLFEEADCVVAVGAQLSTHTLAGGYLYSKARFIHIDIEPHKVMGNDRSADCYIQGDATATQTTLSTRRQGAFSQRWHR